jgi:hypothetical protein
MALFLVPPLSQLEPSTTALALALLSLVPPVWIALMGLPRARNDRHPAADGNADAVSRDFAACALAALAVTLTHALSALPFVFPLGMRSAGLGGLRSLLLHLVVFSGGFAAICVVRGLSRLISPRAVVEAWLARGVLAIALALFLSRVVLRPIALVGVQGTLVAAVLGAALAAAFAAQRAGPASTSAGGLVHRSAPRSAGLRWLRIAVWWVERQAAKSG